ncbi:PEP-CTERM sorting domain-containing protein [Iodobacter sp. HSC-16F04]|uniref:PEP-CTERM sorting domain-containing protein n=1 Tax=Iodobacter violaceini TaxID=3044271 RepID=A0ABX0L0Q1_9NEIS|nr:NF038129 family PEP-CTERM protein [Iodobacter violacea]NHQ86941.1 PEP-CTERM sorting domain-containing protein [Iodobacter violacea]
MKNTLKLALAGLFLACSSMASAAAYHINLDTSSIDGKDGFIAFGLNGLSDSPFVGALLSQYRGSSLGLIDADNTFNVQGDLNTSLKFDNRLLNQFTQGLIFGKQLQFDVEFTDSRDEFGSGTSFTFAVLDKNYAGILGNDPYGIVAQADFIPGAALDFKVNTSLATVTPVPEPETYALMGLGVLGLALRRKRIYAV